MQYYTVQTIHSGNNGHVRKFMEISLRMKKVPKKKKKRIKKQITTKNKKKKSTELYLDSETNIDMFF